MGNGSTKISQTPASQSRMRVFSDIEVPEHLICSLCWEIFQDPVTTRCGHTYCKNCIHACIEKQPECPIDRCAANKKDLVPNKALAGLCHQLLEEATRMAKGYEKSNGVPVQMENKSFSDLNKIFSDVSSIHLVCQFHDGILIDPVLLRCGHSMCRKCLDLQFRKGAWRCICRRKINTRDPVPNRNAADFLSETSLRCRFGMTRGSDGLSYLIDHDGGCQTLLKQAERQQHESTCNHVMVLCPCNESCRPIRRIHLESHIEIHSQETAPSNLKPTPSRKWSIFGHRNKSFSACQDPSIEPKGLFSDQREEIVPASSSPCLRQCTKIEETSLVLHSIEGSADSWQMVDDHRLSRGWQHGDEGKEPPEEKQVQLQRSRPTSRDIRSLSPENITILFESSSIEGFIEQECYRLMKMADSLFGDEHLMIHSSQMLHGSMNNESSILDSSSRDAICSL